MSTHDPERTRRIVADLDARLSRMTAEIADLRAGLRIVDDELAHAPSPDRSPEPRPVPIPEPAFAEAPAPARTAVPAAAPPVPTPPAPTPPVPTPPATRRRPRITAATVIAAIGGSVMLAGIAFLLVVAAQAGLFPPIARVIAAAALAAALVALGLRLQARHESRGAGVNPGALALVGTGIAAAILDVIACTTLYEWIPVPAAYALVGALAVAGIALAQRWASGLLACLVAGGAILLAPLISTGVELPVFVVILAAATAVLGPGLGLPLRAVWSILPMPFLAFSLADADAYPLSERIMLLVAAVCFAAVGAGIAWNDSLRRDPPPANAGLVVVPTGLPLLLLPTLSTLGPGWLVGLLLGAPYLVGTVLAHRHRGEPAALLAATYGLVATGLLTVALFHIDEKHVMRLTLMLAATAYVVAAGLWRRRWLDAVAVVGTGAAVLAYAESYPPTLTLIPGTAERDLEAVDVAASLVITLLAVAVTWWALRRLPRRGVWVAVAGAITALLTASAAVVALGVVLGRLAGDATAGFLVAHLVVTVLWICCAAWLVLTRGTRVPEARRIGFALGGLALAKLILLDLATLPGLFRVLSFIVVGAVMLAVAVRYRSDTDPSGSGSPT